MTEVHVYQTVHKSLGVSRERCIAVVRAVLREVKQSGEVSVHMIGDTRMRTLNRIHRGKDKTTDVLAFALLEGDIPHVGEDLGDIFLSVPQIRRQAKAHGVSFQEECIRMLTHGTLHLLGYDHQTPEEERVMFGLQERIVARIS